jgi:hypothetical protein
MTRLVAVLLSLDTVMLMSGAGGARPQTGVENPGISGYVLTPDGVPVSGGTVAVRGIGAATAPIDPAGRFRVVPPRPGVHQFLVSVSGFAPYRFIVTVPPSRTLRLPVIRLAEGAFFRVRLVSARGEPILGPPLHRRMFDANGRLIDGPGDQLPPPSDSDGTITMGPLPRGIMTLAADVPLFAQTRLPDANVVDPTKNVNAGTIAIQQPGAVVRVNVVDGAGAPVSNHLVSIEDPRPRSPMSFRPELTNPQGRVSFDRLAAGQYRVSSPTVDRCAGVWLTASRIVPVSTNGTVDMPLVIGGRATFRLTSPLGPEVGVQIVASPDAPTPPWPFSARVAPSGCRGVTDRDGRVTLTNFPPGPARIDVHKTNSTYTRRVEVPPDQHEVAVAIPDGFLPVHVVNDKNEPVSGAAIIWTSGGARVEASAMATGDALLEGVGSANGTLAVSAQGYQPTEDSLAEPPGVLYTVSLMRLPPPARLRARVTTVSGEPLRDAVVEFLSADPAAVPRVALTDGRGTVTFGDVPPGSGQLSISANGFVMSKVGVAPEATGEVAVMLSRGYRANIDVEMTAAAGSQVVHVMTEDHLSMDDVLDLNSDRRIDRPGHLSIGSLAPGTYVVELRGTGGPRQERIRIVDRDVAAMIR